MSSIVALRALDQLSLVATGFSTLSIARIGTAMNSLWTLCEQLPTPAPSYRSGFLVGLWLQAVENRGAKVGI